MHGTLLDGRYLVQAKIASGGTSTVYRGLDVRLDRPVALKVMESRYAGDDQFLTRFQLEARTVARLKNPGLVAVYDQGLDARHPFLVMELIEGGTLRELLAERGPMPPHAVVAVLRPVLGGLAAGIWPDMPACLAAIAQRRSVVEPDAAWGREVMALGEAVFASAAAGGAPVPIAKAAGAVAGAVSGGKP